MIAKKRKSIPADVQSLRHAIRYQINTGKLSREAAFAKVARERGFTVEFVKERTGDVSNWARKKWKAPVLETPEVEPQTDQEKQAAALMKQYTAAGKSAGSAMRLISIAMRATLDEVQEFLVPPHAIAVKSAALLARLEAEGGLTQRAGWATPPVVDFEPIVRAGCLDGRM